MKNVAKLMLGVFLALASGIALAATEVEGIWSSITRSKGGLGSQWTFTRDGHATYTFGAVVDFRYKTTESQIAMTPMQPGGATEAESSSEFSIDGDNLTLNPRDTERRQVMRRVSAAPDKSSLIGEWTYKHYTGEPAFMRYSRTGQAQLVVPMITLEGTYRIEDDRLVINLSGQAAPVTGAVADGQSLSIRDAQGRETMFKRFQY